MSGWIMVDLVDELCCFVFDDVGPYFQVNFLASSGTWIKSHE